MLQPGLGTQAWKINSLFTRVGWASEKAGATAFVHLPAVLEITNASTGFSGGNGAGGTVTLVSSPPPQPRTPLVSS